MPAPRRSRKPAASNGVVLAPDGRNATCDGVRFQLARPDTTERDWIGQDEILRQLLACWLVVDERDQPLTPRIKGVPGIGKTTLGMAAARAAASRTSTSTSAPPTRGPRTCSSRRCSAEAGQDRLPRVAARHRHGARRRLHPRRGQPHEREELGVAWRRSSTSAATSRASSPASQVPAHPNFRACVTMNEDESTFEIPDYILSRLQPTLEVAFPTSRRRDGDPASTTCRSPRRNSSA